MWADRDAVLCGHEHHAEDLVDSRHTARVDLTDVDRVRLEELLKDHPVVGVFSGCCEMSE
jgi:hypothetical protein